MRALSFPVNPVLLVDDEQQFLQSASMVLRSVGVNNVLLCSDSREVIPTLLREKIYLIILDLSMPYLSGEEILKRVKQEYPELPVIILTALNEVQKAVDCLKNGASDYLVKPVDDNHFVATVKKMIELQNLRHENISLKEHFLAKQLKYPEAFSRIVTRNPPMHAIFKYIGAISNTPAPVMITGETGTGKELIAEAVHICSKRHGKFVPVNVAGLDDNLFSDTLFGHRKGAFTDASSNRLGLIEKASSGTLFLDEIGDLSESSQVKLLRLLQEHEYFTLGSDIPRRSDARIVVATNRKITEIQDNRRLRKDLYHRLRVHHVDIPPLRDKRDDIPFLVEYFLEEAAELLGKKIPSYPPELITFLGSYNFPGNVRELQSMIFDSVANHESGILSMNTFKTAIKQENYSPEISDTPSGKRSETFFSFFGRFPTFRESEKLLISEAMKRSEGNQAIAAKLLGVTRQALNRRLRKSRDADSHL